FLRSSLGHDMGVKSGMRGTDLQKFLMVARDFNVIILVRHTNPDSLEYVGQTGFYPKPAIVKAKTADVNPPPLRRLVNGKVETKNYDVAGLVVHPDFQPQAYLGAKQQKAKTFWNQTMHYLGPTLEQGPPVDLENPNTWSIW